MAPKTKSLAVGFCLDESGSMGAVRDATISGFNEYVDDLRLQKGRTWMSLTMFSSQTSDENYRTVCSSEPIKTAPKLSVESYRPRGNTPLLDAIGHTIRAMEDRLAGAEPDAVLFVIQTDGHENASREWTRSAVVELIRQKEADGWRFVYLGANQDEIEAETLSTGLGVAARSSVGYAYHDTHSTVSALAATSDALRATPTLSSSELAAKTRSEAERRRRRPKA